MLFLCSKSSVIMFAFQLALIQAAVILNTLKSYIFQVLFVNLNTDCPPHDTWVKQRVQAASYLTDR